MEYLVYFYPSILILGIITSYTDIRYKQIKNKHLLLGLISGLLIYLYLYYSHLRIISIPFFIMNILLALCLAYFLNWKRLWSAGDAKLFIVLSFLFPFSRHQNLFKFPSLVLFISISIIGFFSVLIIEFKNIFMNIKYLKPIIFKDKFRSLFYSFLIVYAISWLIWFLFKKVSFSGQFFVFALIYLCYYFIRRWLKKIRSQKLFFSSVLLFGVILRIFFQPEIVFSLSKTFQYFFRILKYAILFNFLDLLLILINTERLKKKDIPFAPFMFLGTFLAETPIISYIMGLLMLLKK